MEQHQGSSESVRTTAKSESKRQGVNQQWEVPISAQMPDILQRVRADPRTLSPVDVAILQETIGNQAVVRMFTASAQHGDNKEQRHTQAPKSDPLKSPLQVRANYPEVSAIQRTEEGELQTKQAPGTGDHTPAVHPSTLFRAAPSSVQRLCSKCEAEMQRQGKPVPAQRKIAHSPLHNDRDDCDCDKCTERADRDEETQAVPPKRAAGYALPIMRSNAANLQTLHHGGSPFLRPTGLAQSVQRDIPGPGAFPTPGDPFGLFAPKNDQLRFTKRWFPNLSQPTVCPRCHDHKPSGPQLPQYVDQDATEPRLVGWGQESDLMLHHGGTIRILQLDPNAIDILVDDYGVGLTKRITSSHEFEGSDAVRVKGAETIRARWGDIRPVVRERLSTWYREQLFEAVSLTPKWASPVLDPGMLKTSLASHYGERASLGRWGAEAVPGQKYGVFEIDDIGLGQIWFHLPGRPLWRYQISRSDFIRHDPFVAGVAEQVYDKTKWILQVMPLIMKVGAFAMGFSGNIAVIIAGIVLDELATEMQADAEGRPGRSVDEILGSGATQLIIDRIFHGLLGGGAGRAAAGAGKSAARIEKIAEAAVPAIRREIAQAEKPLVKQALESGTARQVTDQALKAEGHVVEVAVEAAGESHIYRLNRRGLWCRASTPICDLDLGADIVAAAKSPASFTKAKLADTRALIGDIEGEITFLGKMYERMKAAGKVDMSLLSKEERALLDQLAPSGDAAKLSLRELRDLPRKLGLKREIAAAADQEAKLIQQLYREGRPLYEIMRAASPSSAVRSRVLGEAYGRDAATGIVARSGALHVDHVVPLNDIVRMNGFDKLRPERQLEIVNDVKNLRAIDSLANASRGDRSWWNWAQAQLYYDSAQIAKMRALEDNLRSYIEGRIRALLRP